MCTSHIQQNEIMAKLSGFPSTAVFALLIVPSLELLLFLAAPPLPLTIPTMKGHYELNITVIKKRTGQIETSFVTNNTIPVTNVDNVGRGPSSPGWVSLQNSKSSNEGQGQGFLVAASPFDACSKLTPKPKLVSGPDSFTHLLVSFFNRERRSQSWCDLEYKLRQADNAGYSMVLVTSDEQDQYRKLPNPSSDSFREGNGKFFHSVTHVALLSPAETALVKRYVYPDTVRFFLTGQRLPGLSAWSWWLCFYLYREGGLAWALGQIYVYLFGIMYILKVTIEPAHEKPKQRTPTPEIDWKRKRSNNPADHNADRNRKLESQRKSSAQQQQQQLSRSRQSESESESPSSSEESEENSNAASATATATGNEIPQDDLVTFKGQVFARQRLLGRGAFGSVWLVKGKSKKMKKRYALKQCNFKEETVTEAKAAVSSEGQDRDQEQGGGDPDRIANAGARLIRFLENGNGYPNVFRVEGPDNEGEEIAQPLDPEVMIAEARGFFLAAFQQQWVAQRKAQRAADLHAIFIREVEILQHLKRSACASHIVQLVDWDLDTRNAPPSYGRILMECGGEDLRARVLSQGTFTHGDLVTSIWPQIVRAVACLRSHGIVHFDLKHTNFVWFGNMLKVVDFGTAWTIKALKENAASENPVGIGGTPAFIAPEILLDRVDEIGPPADVWSIGCILYFFLCGKMPLEDLEKDGRTDDREARQAWLEALTDADIAPAVPPPAPGVLAYYDYNAVLRECLRIDPRLRARPNESRLAIKLVQKPNPVSHTRVAQRGRSGNWR